MNKKNWFCRSILLSNVVNSLLVNCFFFGPLQSYFPLQLGLLIYIYSSLQLQHELELEQVDKIFKVLNFLFLRMRHHSTQDVTLRLRHGASNSAFLLSLSTTLPKSWHLSVGFRILISELHSSIKKAWVMKENGKRMILIG